MKKKTFILDTNVILHDYRCIQQFEENDIVIPITVLEELDNFKKGNDTKNFNTREFIRKLDEIVGNNNLDDLTDFVSRGEKLGDIKVSLNTQRPKKDEKYSLEDTPDHRILFNALNEKENTNREVILITKDINLRMKAKSFGLAAQDYLADNVEVSNFFKEVGTQKEVSSDLIDELYSNVNGTNCFPLNQVKNHHKFLEEEGYFNLNSKNKSILLYSSGEELEVLKNQNIYGIEPRNREQKFASHALLDESKKLIAITGPAGTGKTLLSLAVALQENEKHNQILLARPIMPLSNKDIGFLPGDVGEKIGPYMQPLFDNLSFIKGQTSSANRKKIEILQRDDKLLISPLAYIRGRSLANVFFIVDEAQNLTPHEIKTIITRAAEGTRIILTGDVDQIDSPYLSKESNGLSYVISKMSEQSIFSHVHLIKGERSNLATIASKML